MRTPEDNDSDSDVATSQASVMRPTVLLSALDPVADRAAIERAAAFLRAGQLVAFPTETVYGLGADATRADAAARIFTAKERPLNDPLIVHVAGVEDVPAVARVDPSLAARVYSLAERFWPGPLTLVLPRANAIPAIVAAGGDTVGVRVPAHPIAQALIRAAGVPVAAPSANRFMHTSPTTAAHVLADLDGRIACVLDGGPCSVGVESTVLDLTATPPRVLRPGGITLEALRAALGDVEPPPEATRRSTGDAIKPAGTHTSAPRTPAPARSPGQHERHYAPSAVLEVWDGDGLAARQAMRERVRAAVAAGERVGALVPDEEAPTLAAAGARVCALGPAANLTLIASRLYAGLRVLDDQAVDRIVAHTFGEEGLALALSDRLRRAAGGHLISPPTR